MPTGDGRDGAELRDGAILIDLTPPEAERVQPKRARWTAVLIALFTALTCGGLASQTIVPRLIDRAADRDSGAVPPPSAVGAPRPPAVPEHVTAALSPVIVARAELRVAGEPRVRIAGTALVTVRTIEVTVTVAGRSVGRAVVGVDPDASTVNEESAVGRAAWQVDVPLPAGTGSISGDGVATANVRWVASPAGPGGSTDWVIRLGDGRGRG